MKGKRLLLIEDSADIQAFVGTVARLEGAKVAIAATGEEGLALYEAGPEFDVIIVDLYLPGMSGWDAIEAIRARAPKDPRPAPVVIFTANADATTIDRARQLGVADVIVKPVAAPDLVTRLKAILA